MKTNTPGNGMKREGTESRGCDSQDREHTRWSKAENDPFAQGPEAAFDELIAIMDEAADWAHDLWLEYCGCGPEIDDLLDRRTERLERAKSWLECMKHNFQQWKANVADERQTTVEGFL